LPRWGLVAPAVAADTVAKGRHDPVAAHLAEGDFHDLGHSVAIKDVGDGIADIDHDHPQAAMLLVRAGAGLVGVFAGAADRCQPAVHQANDVADADLVRRLGQCVAAELAALGFHDPGLAQFEQDALHELERQAVLFGQLGARHGAPAYLGGHAQIDSGAERVFGFL